MFHTNSKCLSSSSWSPETREFQTLSSCPRSLGTKVHSVYYYPTRFIQGNSMFFAMSRVGLHCECHFTGKWKNRIRYNMGLYNGCAMEVFELGTRPWYSVTLYPKLVTGQQYQINVEIILLLS